VKRANQSTADYILLDSKEGGSGTVFDWELLEAVERPYFLAGGLGVENVGEAVRRLHPYAVDVSSGIETDGVKDEAKMKAFVECVRKEK
jgi:phosphoribosylanthranilate isomerase